MSARLSIAQDILRKNTDFFRRIIALVAGMGESPCRASARIVIASLFGRITSGGVSPGRGDGQQYKDETV